MVNVTPGQIEVELEKIWDSLQGTNKMRACLFNLIICAKESQRTTYLDTMIQKIIGKFPCRVLFVARDDKCANCELKTAVSVLTADEGKSEIACDLIEIKVCASDHSRVPFLILPHILPDLPVYLLYTDDPTHSHSLADRLKHLADRIIFDAEETSDIFSFAQAILRHNSCYRGDVADLNWGRTEEWRQLFATIFKRGDSLQEVARTKKIEIYYNAKKKSSFLQTPVQSIYLQGWIAAQLGWRVKAVHSELHFQYQSAGGNVDVHLIPQVVDSLPNGKIMSVELQTIGSTHYSFARSVEYPQQIKIEKSSPDLCSLPTDYIFDKGLSKQSLIREICHSGTSSHYIKMLTLLTSIKWGSL